MTIYRRGGIWYYDFWFEGARYRESTKQTDKKAASEVEDALRSRLRRQAAGLLPDGDASVSPRIQEWAEVYLADASKRLGRPERVETLLRVVLRFWGAKPPASNRANPPVDGEPYHDLRLVEPVVDPDWVARFEDWLDARTARGSTAAERVPLSGQAKNQYRSCMRQMYKLANQPRYRKHTGVLINPFDGIFRDKTRGKTVVIEPDDVRRLLGMASYHVRLAIAIGALAPKLRVANILALRWGINIDPALRYITVREHKTVAVTKRPLVIPISDQLRVILQDARSRNPGDVVVCYRGKAVKSIRGGIRRAAGRAGLTYGRALDDGLTFHTLRHTAATLLAELDVSEAKRQAVMGHRRIETTQLYTHLRPLAEAAPLEQLSGTLPIKDLVMLPWRRARRNGVPGPGGTTGGTRETPAAASPATEAADDRPHTRTGES